MQYLGMLPSGGNGNKPLETKPEEALAADAVE